MSISTDKLSQQIADLYGREYCILVGRATTGIKLLLDELASPDGSVMFPAYICPIAVYPAFYAGHRPVFCDVSIDDYNATPETISDALTPDVDVLVASHMFGHPLDMDGLREVCTANNVTIIEDAANALGGGHGTTDMGAFGTASVVSFGNLKPLDAGGGGAILTDDYDLAERVEKAAASLPVLDEDEHEALHERYVDVYSAVQSLRDIEPRGIRLLAEFPAVFERLFVHGFPDRNREPLAAALNRAGTLIERRRQVAELYQRELDIDAVTHPVTTGEPVHFRYGFLVENEARRDCVLATLREDGRRINSLHEPVPNIFDDGGTYPGAEEVSSRILNLRDDPLLDDKRHLEYIQAVQDAIARCR